MISHDVTTQVDALVRAHALNTSFYREHVVVHGSGLALHAQARDLGSSSPARLQLDVSARDVSLGDRCVVESFAGVGDTFEQAVHNALKKFADASLHVLLASFVDRKLCTDQVQWERWSDSKQGWDVCLGPLLLSSTSIQVPSFGDLLDQLRDLFLAGATPTAHWIRTFRGAAGSTSFGSEVLIDNHEWPEGKSIVDTWPWPVVEPFLSARHLLIALPAD